MAHLKWNTFFVLVYFFLQMFDMETVIDNITKNISSKNI